MNIQVKKLMQPLILKIYHNLSHCECHYDSDA